MSICITKNNKGRHKFGSFYLVAETHDDKVGNEISETTSTEGNNFIEDSSSTPAAAPEGSRKSVLSVTNAEALLHKALDAASSDHNKESGFSGNGEANTVSVFFPTENQSVNAFDILI